MRQRQRQQTREPIWTRDFILIMLANLFVFLGFQMLMPVMPVYATMLGGSNAWAGVVVGVFTVSALLIRPIAGHLLDNRGRKTVFMLGLAVFMLCAVTYSFISTVVLLVAVRFIHGFGWGIASTASNTIAADIIPKSRLGEAMGYFGLTSTLAMAAGPALGLSLLDTAGAHTVFWVSATMLLVTVVIARSIRYRATSHTAVAQSISVKSLLEKAAIPAAVIMSLNTLSYGAIISFIALYAAEQGVENIGLFFTVYAVSLLVVRLFVGRVADSRGFSYAIYPGIAAVLAAMLLLASADSLGSFLLAGAVYGLGFGALQPTLQAMAVQGIKPQRFGAANATFFVGFDLGIGTGAMLWGVVAQTTGYQAIYLWSVLPVVISLILFAGLERSRKNRARLSGC